jgi:quinol monooxygenase YgiN
VADHVITVISATIGNGREDDLRAAYQAVIDEKLPDGLLATALLRGDNNTWQIASLWRDQAALETMRTAPGAPAAPRVFRNAGAEPTVTLFDVVLGTGLNS